MKRQMSKNIGFRPLLLQFSKLNFLSFAVHTEQMIQQEQTLQIRQNEIKEVQESTDDQQITIQTNI